MMETRSNGVDWRFVLRGATWLGPVLWLYLLIVQWNYLPQHLTTDAQAYYLAAEYVRKGGSPYTELPLPGPHVLGVYPWYLYPPPLAAALALLPLSAKEAYNLFIVLGVLGTFGFAWAIQKLVGWRWQSTVLGLYLFPNLVSMGNAEPFVQGLSTVALLSSPAVAVFLLATGAALKVTPIWPLGVALVRRSGWSGLLVALGLWGGITLAALGIGGAIDACVTWLQSVAPTLAQGQFDGGESVRTMNLSPSFAPLRLLLAGWPQGMEVPAWARVYLIAVQLGIPAFAICLTRRLPWNEQAGWALVAAILAAPIVHVGYLPILVLAGALWWRLRIRTAPGRDWTMTGGKRQGSS